MRVQIWNIYVYNHTSLQKSPAGDSRLLRIEMDQSQLQGPPGDQAMLAALNKRYPPEN